MSDRSSRSSGVFDKLFKKRMSATEIGEPTEMRQIIHVSRDPETGQLQGLPAAWIKLLNSKKDRSDRNDSEEKSKSNVEYTAN